MEHVDKRYWTLLNALMTTTGFISATVYSLSGSRFQLTSCSVMRGRFHISKDTEFTWECMVIGIRYTGIGGGTRTYLPFHLINLTRAGFHVVDDDRW